jgi:hypothetical protein
MATKLSPTGADTLLAGLSTALNGGFVRIYNGTEPTSATAALSGNTLLAQLTFAATAFGSPTTSGSNRVITANLITADSSADAEGVASFFRAVQSNGTVIFQGTAGAGAELVMTGPGANPYQVYLGGPVEIQSLTIAMPI